jgi:hypothetical protein
MIALFLPLPDVLRMIVPGSALTAVDDRCSLKATMVIDARRLSGPGIDLQPLQLMACTGQVSIASWHLQVSHLSGPITWDFSFTISNTRGQTSAQLPQPIQVSSSTTGTFAIDAPSS